MNRLHKESSLYLRQHADNPVHWQPWDDDALEAARRRQRPILLSIGYSACHWCHVMAHESFEDEATAAAMNRLFVNIKVDREERPDLDRIYQLAHQLLTGRGGGWPLTVFLDPVEHVPFFAGTYFPGERRYGMPAFREVLEAIARWYGENQGALPEQNEKLRTALNSLQLPAAGESELDPTRFDELLAGASAELQARLDRVNGGFGGAPKFPQAPLLEAVAMLASAARDGAADQALRLTLERMASSGLRDHLDGGFFRYCVDADWTIPHFEKMLYDNAMLLPLYAEAAQRRGSPDFRATAVGITRWLEGAMRAAPGGYAASIDADADGEEGAFHLWQPDAVGAILDEGLRATFVRAYGLDGPPNFEGKAWHLLRRVDNSKLAAEFDLDKAGVETRLADARAALWQKREERPHPTRDDKRLTSWNALLAGGLVRAARALDRGDWLDRAEEIVGFIRQELWTPQGLLAVYNDGEARFPAYLDDYAWLLQALMELLGERFDRGTLDFAMALADALLERFEDRESGGFYFSDAAVEVPLGRSMGWQDDATPSGNGIAILALTRLGHLLGEVRYLDAARRAAARAAPAVEQAPLAHATILRALRELVRPSAQLIVGGRDFEAIRDLTRTARGYSELDCYVLGDVASTEAALPGLLSQYHSDRPASAWLCRGTQCQPPVHTAAELDRLLGETED